MATSGVAHSARPMSTCRDTSSNGFSASDAGVIVTELLGMAPALRSLAPNRSRGRTCADVELRIAVACC